MEISAGRDLAGGRLQGWDQHSAPVLRALRQRTPAQGSCDAHPPPLPPDLSTWRGRIHKHTPTGTREAASPAAPAAARLARSLRLDQSRLEGGRQGGRGQGLGAGMWAWPVEGLARPARPSRSAHPTVPALGSLDSSPGSSSLSGLERGKQALAVPSRLPQCTGPGRGKVQRRPSTSEAVKDSCLL